MSKEQVKYEKPLIRCFSDSVYRIDAKGQRSKRVIFVSEFNIYMFECEKGLKLTRQFPVEKISLVIFSEVVYILIINQTSPILCCLVVKGSDDYLMETFKRSELNQFMTEVIVQRKLELYELEFKISFTVQFKGFKQPKKIEDIANGVYMSGSKQAAFKISQKQGIL